MLRFAADVQAVEVLSSEGPIPTAPQHAAATFRNYCWPPLHGDPSDSGEPPSKRRRVSAENSIATEESFDGRLGHICLSHLRFDLVSMLFISAALPLSEN